MLIPHLRTSHVLVCATEQQIRTFQYQGPLFFGALAGKLLHQSITFVPELTQ